MGNSGLGIPGFDDLFFGDEDKNYLDYNAKEMTRIRGLEIRYYSLRDSSRAVDGKYPVSTKPDYDPLLDNSQFQSYKNQSVA